MIGFGISTRNRRDQIFRTLHAVQRFAPHGSTIFVSDDASDDGTPETLSQWMMMKQADIEKAEQSVSFSTAPQRQGVAATKKVLTDVLLENPEIEDIILIEDDVEPLNENWYKHFLHTAATNQQAHLLYMPTDWKYGKTMIETGPVDATIQWKQYCSGLVMYFKAALLREVGSFDVRFGIYGYDHNLLSAQCLVAQGLNPERYPHCFIAEKNNSLLAYDVTVKRLPYHENAQHNKDMSMKLQLARMNEPLYKKELNKLREKFSLMKSTDSLPLREKFFPVAKTATEQIT
jgi:hypothetical protein